MFEWPQFKYGNWIEIQKGFLILFWMVTSVYPSIPVSYFFSSQARVCHQVVIRVFLIGLSAFVIVY